MTTPRTTLAAVRARAEAAAGGGSWAAARAALLDADHAGDCPPRLTRAARTLLTRLAAAGWPAPDRAAGLAAAVVVGWGDVWVEVSECPDGSLAAYAVSSGPPPAAW